MVEKAPAKKRVRRTYAQIAADKAAEEERRDKLAAERAAKIPAPVSPKWSKTFHFVDDGFTVFGKVWYRGEEITIEEGDDYFARAFDRKGNFVFSKNENEQTEIYGRVLYREGPWTGLPYDTTQVYEPGQFDASDKPVKAGPNEIALLEKANKKRKLG